MVTFLNKPFYIDTSVCMHACNQLFYIQETQHCLFGLSELGSVFATNPRNSNLEEAGSGHNVTYVQLYTSMVKAMEQRVPLNVRPHLLTYLLGEGCVSSRDKF